MELTAYIPLATPGAAIHEQCRLNDVRDRRAFMSTKVGGVLAIWHDMTPQGEADVNDWYNHEHHLERVSVSGFFNARRHVALRGTPKYFIFYETESPEVLISRTYLDHLNNPTAWTQRSMLHIHNNSRSVCRTLGAFGAGHGGVVATFRLRPNDRARGTTGEDPCAPAQGRQRARHRHRLPVGGGPRQDCRTERRKTPAW